MKIVNAKELQLKLRKLGSPERAEHALRFFKTGPGQYGEGDKFIGVTVPERRELVKNCLHFDSKQITILLKSKIHEDRASGVAILTEQFRKSKEQKFKAQIYKLYLAHKDRINNWDLVDGSAPNIVGEFAILTQDTKLIKKLIKSKHHWDRRIAMVSTLAFIRKGELDIAFWCAQQVLEDEQDLMHKASGWMLREAGKRNDKALLKFITTYGKRMPRTMLRYAIEKFSPKVRKEILLQTKNHRG